MSELGPVVIPVDEQTDHVDIRRWAELAEATLRAEGVMTGELNLVFVDEPEMRTLNGRHMGDDHPTDVLSFPLDGREAGIVGETLVGDVVVCPARAAAQAREHAGAHHDGSVADELARLVVHGVLHVVGYDHEKPEDAALMRAREQQLLSLHYRP